VKAKVELERNENFCFLDNYERLYDMREYFFLVW